MYKIKISIDTITGKTYTSYTTIDDGEGNTQEDYDAAWEIYQEFYTLIEDAVSNKEKITSVVLDDPLEKRKGNMLIINPQHIVAAKVEFVEFGYWIKK